MNLRLENALGNSQLNRDKIAELQTWIGELRKDVRLAQSFSRKFRKRYGRYGLWQYANVTTDYWYIVIAREDDVTAYFGILDTEDGNAVLHVRGAANIGAIFDLGAKRNWTNWKDTSEVHSSSVLVKYPDHWDMPDERISKTKEDV